MQLTILDMFKIWESLDASGPLSDQMEKAKEHLEAQLSTLILDLKLNLQPTGAQPNG